MGRFVVLGALALLVGVATGAPSKIQSVLGPEEDPHLEPALSLRCDQGAPKVRRDCEEDLKRDFEKGRLEPEVIVRRHCTRYESSWSLEVERPAEVCRELYGGWIEG